MNDTYDWIAAAGVAALSSALGSVWVSDRLWAHSFLPIPSDPYIKLSEVDEIVRSMQPRLRWLGDEWICQAPDSSICGSSRSPHIAYSMWKFRVSQELITKILSRHDAQRD